MSDNLAHIFVNFSKRKVTLVDEEGYEKYVQWKWDIEGAAGFAETVADLQEVANPDLITFCFAAQ